MDELKAMLKAVKDLQNSGSDTLVEAIDGLIEAVIATGARLTYLSTWLESRGLPLDWTGPLNSWGWVLYDNNGNVAGYDHAGPGEHPPGDVTMMERWDEVPEKDRAEALRIEAERRNG